LLLFGSPPGFADSFADSAAPWPGAEGLEVLQSHGEADGMCGAAAAAESAEALRALGCHARFSLHSGVGHTISPGMVAEARAWLSQRLPPAAGMVAPKASAATSSDPVAKVPTLRRSAAEPIAVEHGESVVAGPFAARMFQDVDPSLLPRRAEEADEPDIDSTSFAARLFQGVDSVVLPQRAAEPHADGRNEPAVASANFAARLFQDTDAAEVPLRLVESQAAASNEPPAASADFAGRLFQDFDAVALPPQTGKSGAAGRGENAVATESFVARLFHGALLEDAMPDVGDGSPFVAAGVEACPGLGAERVAVGDRSNVRCETPLIQDADGDDEEVDPFSPDVIDDVELELAPWAAQPAAPAPPAPPEDRGGVDADRGVVEEEVLVEPTAPAAPAAAPKEGKSDDAAAPPLGPEGTAAQSPLVAAVRSGDIGEVKRVLRGRADPNVRNSALGETVLFEAARRCRSDLVAVLLLGKGDATLRDAQGRSPHDVAAASAAGLRDPLVVSGGSGVLPAAATAVAQAPPLAALLRLAAGGEVAPREQRAAFAILEECTRWLVASLLMRQRAHVAVEDVLSDAQWDATCAA